MKEIPSNINTIYGGPTHWTVEGVECRTPISNIRMAEYVQSTDDACGEKVWEVFARDIRKGKYKGCTIYSAACGWDDGGDRLTVLFEGDPGKGPTWGEKSTEVRWYQGDSFVTKSPTQAAEISREWAAKGYVR